MKTSSKILVTIGIVIAFLFFFGLVTAASKSSGHSTPGVLGLVLGFGLLAGLRSVWKKDDKGNDKNDSHQLDKRE